MSVPYKVGDPVLLSREREGFIRYVGKVHFSKKIYCGIELVGGAMGDNDGKTQGRRYFTCPKNRGIFVKIGRVRRKFRDKDNTANKRQKRKESIEQRLYHRTITTTNVIEEFKMIDNNKHSRTNKRIRINNIQFNDIDVEIVNKKATNYNKYRRNKSNKAAPTSLKTKVSWLKERLNSPSTKTKRNRAQSSRPYKPGPRDIGRVKNSGWKPISLSQEQEQKLNAGGWQKEKLSSPISSNRMRSKTAPKVYKPGPRDIGKIKGNTGWKPIELSPEEEKRLNSGGWQNERLNKTKSPKNKQKIYKPGPRDIGKNKSWRPKKFVKSVKKKFKIKVNDNVVNPKLLPHLSKKKNKELMKNGGKSGNKNKKKNKKKKKKSKKKDGKKKKSSNGGNKDWKPQKFHRNKKNTDKKSKSGYKAGPRGIGRNNDWTQDVIITEKEKHQSMFDKFNVKKQQNYGNNQYNKFKRKSHRGHHHQQQNSGNTQQRQSVVTKMNDNNIKYGNNSKYYRQRKGQKQRHSVQTTTTTTTSSSNGLYSDRQKNRRRISKNMYNKQINNIIDNGNDYINNIHKSVVNNSDIVINAKYDPYNAVKMGSPKGNNAHYFASYTDNNNKQLVNKYQHTTTSGLDLGDDDMDMNIGIVFTDDDDGNRSGYDDGLYFSSTDNDNDNDDEKNIIKQSQAPPIVANNNNNNNGSSRPSQNIFDLFSPIDEQDDDNNSSHSNEYDLDDDYKYDDGNYSPSGHDHIYDHDGNHSPSGHDHIYNDIIPPYGSNKTHNNDNDISITAVLFTDNQNIRKNKPLPPLTQNKAMNMPNKPLPSINNNNIQSRSRHQKQNSRIILKSRGIESYIGKWIISFPNMKSIDPPSSSSPFAPKRILKNGRKKGSSKRNLLKSNHGKYIYSIYKDGSVQIKPKNAFGWNGKANCVYDTLKKQFEIHNTDADDEYDIISINNDATLRIQHFDKTRSFIGTGIRDKYG